MDLCMYAVIVKHTGKVCHAVGDKSKIPGIRAIFDNKECAENWLDQSGSTPGAWEVVKITKIEAERLAPTTITLRAY